MAIIKVADLAYVRMHAPDLGEAERFFVDFGLVVASATSDRLILRGYGPERQLLVIERGDGNLAAVAFTADTRADLDRAAAAAGVAVTPRQEEGGGHVAVLADPDGNTVELVHGIAAVDPMPVDHAPTNDGSDRYRRVGTIRRPRPGASHVLRLGHVVLTTPQPQELAAWYRDMFGLLVSDEVFAGAEDNVLLSFNRLDRGDTYVDHHVFQTMAGPPGGVHHISFEVPDVDDLQLGHAHLQQAGYRHMWGIGRHLQGSQIFDYWIDPFGVMYEHWTDSDLLNASSQPARQSVEGSTGPWGPPMPADFITQVA